MSLFGELDVASADDDPYSIPDNTYETFLYDVKVGPTKANDKIGMTLVFKISEGQYEGREIREWKWVPQPVDPKNPTQEEASAASYLKARMVDLGVTADRMNSIEPDELIGIKCTVTVKTKNGYANVRGVKLS